MFAHGRKVFTVAGFVKRDSIDITDWRISSFIMRMNEDDVGDDLRPFYNDIHEYNLNANSFTRIQTKGAYFLSQCAVCGR